MWGEPDLAVTEVELECIKHKLSKCMVVPNESDMILAMGVHWHRWQLILGRSYVAYRR